MWRVATASAGRPRCLSNTVAFRQSCCYSRGAARPGLRHNGQAVLALVHGSTRLAGSPLPSRLRQQRKRLPCFSVQPLAMVNVDVSPSVILGVGLIGAGVSLWQIRQAKPWISKDYDVVVSCISLLVGGILIFQGWRLDPLLLFGQLMTTGAAVSFGVEALRLRSAVYEQEEKAALQDVFRRKGPGGKPGGGDGGSLQLPPPPPPFAGGNRNGWDSRAADAEYYANAYVDDQAQPVGTAYGEQQQAGAGPRWGGYGGSNYVEADYYDAEYPAVGQPYGDDDDQYYYDNGNGSSSSSRGPTQLEFPAEDDSSPGTQLRRGGGGQQQQSSGGEDWD